MRILLRIWLTGDAATTPADHAALDRLSARFAIGAAGVVAVIFIIQFIRQLIGAQS